MALSVKTWIADNVKWIITLTVIGLSNYFILANQIANTSDKVKETSLRVDKIEIWKEENMKEQIIRQNLSNKQVHEIQLNLKSLMEKNGLKYLSITE
jgi:predicted negative regulator of RcsB-dependent stress response